MVGEFFSVNSNIDSSRENREGRGENDRKRKAISQNMVWFFVFRYGNRWDRLLIVGVKYCPSFKRVICSRSVELHDIGVAQSASCYVVFLPPGSYGPRCSFY